MARQRDQHPAVDDISQSDEGLAEARSLVALSLESLAAYTPQAGGERFMLHDVTLRLAEWHPYVVDRIVAGEATSADLDELNYILDELYELNREGVTRANAVLLRVTLWLGRALRIYRDICAGL